MKSFDGRLARQWKAQLSEPCDLHLENIRDRAEDVAAFLPHWARINIRSIPEGALFEETIRLLMAMNMPRGFKDLARLLNEITARDAVIWDPPDPKIWIEVYSFSIMGKQSCLPLILVEGQTDVIYLEWVSVLATGMIPNDLEIEPCQSASKIPQKAFACRNESRCAVSLLDHDNIGIDINKQMQGFELRSMVIPPSYDPLKGCALDHVLKVVEIEDLLPVAQVERFFSETGRQPDLVIYSPKNQLKRIVICSEDKLELALWAKRNLTAEDAESMLKIYNELRENLNLQPVILKLS